MRQIALPEITLPASFARRLNPHAKQAWEHTLTWVKQYALLPEKVFPYLYTLDHYLLAAYAFPEANLEQLELINECLMAFWLFDKQWDDAPPDAIRVMQAPMLDALFDRPSQNPQPQGLEAALRNMRERMMKYCTPAWWERFSKSLAEYFEACVWETHNKSLHKVPDIESYIQQRESTGGVIPSFELGGVLGLAQLPPSLMEDADIRRLSQLANHEITLFNDIISLDKEMRAGDMHNLVFIIKETKNCTLEEAMAQAGKMHNDEVEEFLQLEAKLEAKIASGQSGWDAETCTGVKRYLDVLHCWMRANMDWSLESERYQPQTSAA